MHDENMRKYVKNKNTLLLRYALIYIKVCFSNHYIHRQIILIFLIIGDNTC